MHAQIQIVSNVEQINDVYMPALAERVAFSVSRSREESAAKMHDGIRCAFEKSST